MLASPYRVDALAGAFVATLLSPTASWKNPQRGLKTAAWMLTASGFAESVESTSCDRDDDVAHPAPAQPCAIALSMLPADAAAADQRSAVTSAAMRTGVFRITGLPPSTDGVDAPQRPHDGIRSVP